MRLFFEDSGMRFPYQEESCFIIENSPLVRRLSGVKIVEFVEPKGDRKVVLIEAKTSAPQPSSKDDYDDYLGGIREKFQNSISLLYSAAVKRRPDLFDEFPDPLKRLDYQQANFSLFFVIKESKVEWNIPLQDDLRKQLHPFLKCWNIPDIAFVVLNEELAREIGLVE